MDLQKRHWQYVHSPITPIDMGFFEPSAWGNEGDSIPSNGKENL